MKAVIIPNMDQEKLKPLTDDIPEYLLPVANKPLIEHTIELLVKHGIKDIIVVLKHMAFETEEYLGKGERWGVNISYSLMGEKQDIASCLGRIRTLLNENFICLPANIITNLNIAHFVDMHKTGSSELTIASEPFNNNVSSLNCDLTRLSRHFTNEFRESCPFIATPGSLKYLRPSKEPLNNWINQLVARKQFVYKLNIPHQLHSVNSIKEYWNANQSVLSEEIEDILPEGRQIQEGIWLGKHTKIHPEAKLFKPVLIGDHCVVEKGSRLGPNLTVGSYSLLDENTSLASSVVLGNSYIGVNTEILNSVVQKNCLVNVSRGVTTYVPDDTLLGQVSVRGKIVNGNSFLDPIIAILLLIVFSPVILFGVIFHLFVPARKCLTSQNRIGGWSSNELDGKRKPNIFTLYRFSSPNKFISKLPGLINVVRGNINLVGNCPPYASDISKEGNLDSGCDGSIGLYQFWEAQEEDHLSKEERQVIETSYSIVQSAWQDIIVVAKYLTQSFRKSLT